MTFDERIVFEGGDDAAISFFKRMPDVLVSMGLTASEAEVTTQNVNDSLDEPCTQRKVRRAVHAYLPDRIANPADFALDFMLRMSEV